MILIVAIDLIVVGALAAVVLFKRFESALPLFVFVVTLVPAESAVRLVGLFDLTTQRVAVVALAALWLLAGRRDEGRKRSLPTPLVPLILLISLWGLISGANSIAGAGGLKSALASTFDFYLVFYLFARTVSRVDTVHRVVQGFVAALIVSCVCGSLETYYGWKAIDLFPPVMYRFMPGQGYELDQGRVHGTFPHSILFGNALALGIPWALYCLTLVRTIAQRTYLWLGMLLMFWNIYKTSARGPWLAVILSLLLLTLLSDSRIRHYLLVISLLSASVLVVRPGVWQTIKDTYSETLDPESSRGSSYRYRYTIMSLASELLSKDLARAAWGYGPDSFYALHLQGVNPETGHIVKHESCDSAFVEIVVDSGYVGLLLIVVLLLKPVLVCLRGFRTLPKPANLLCLVFFVNLMAYTFLMISVMNFGWGQQTYMLWIVLAMSMVYPRLAMAQVRRRQAQEGPECCTVHEGSGDGEFPSPNSNMADQLRPEVAVKSRLRKRAIDGNDNDAAKTILAQYQVQ